MIRNWFATINMTFQQTIDVLSFSIQILNFKVIYYQNHEIYKQIIVHCERKQFVQLNFKQWYKILIIEFWFLCKSQNVDEIVFKRKLRD